MRIKVRAQLPILLLLMSGASAPVGAEVPRDRNALVERAISVEKELIAELRDLSPLADIYIQRLRGNAERDQIFTDEYHVGRVLNGSDGPDFQEFQRTSPKKLKPNKIKSPFLARGLIQLELPDNAGLDRDRYIWNYEKEEFLGTLKCAIFDVKPAAGVGPGHFIGRVWIAVDAGAIVRFDGTYTSGPRGSPYVHFRSWRASNGAGLFVPAQVDAYEKGSIPLASDSAFRARVNFWGYKTIGSGGLDESIQVKFLDHSVQEKAEPPNTGLKGVERERRDNEFVVVNWLQREGFLAPPGKAEKTLKAVVSKLLVGADSDIEDRITCRILLSSPAEAFAVNNTLVFSRTLIDLQPDENSLALVIATELAHVLLGHYNETLYSTGDRTMAEEHVVFKGLDLHRNSRERAEAEGKALELLSKSPYRNSLGKSGLFLRGVRNICPQLISLTSPLFGDRIPGCDGLSVLDRVMELAPKIDSTDLGQIAALPLASRVWFDPWTGRAELLKPSGDPPLSALDKFPFQLVPVALALKPENSSTELREDDPPKWLGSNRSDHIAWAALVKPMPALNTLSRQAPR